ncbi:MAG: tetratricopeptide repeat protein [Caulobacterales bacterium]
MAALRTALSIAALGALAACATTGTGSGAAASDTHIDREARRQVAHENLLTQMTFWAQEYAAYPTDLEAGQKFSEALRLGGQFDRASQVASEALSRHEDDQQLLMTLGLAELGARQPNDALQPLAMVAHLDRQNWRARSALGVALDQLGRTDEARRAYQEALALKADDPGVLTNLGVSHLMAGEPAEAETLLRQAAALPNAPPEARQNLAIAVGLQGRFDEAEQLERIDLPPNLVAENMSYIRSLLDNSRSWSSLSGARTRQQ